MDVKTNKMGTEPIPRIMLRMGIPIILSMVLQACYNIVDSIFVAQIRDDSIAEHLGELAVNALTLAFPVQMLIIAFSIGTGVGVNALLARFLGQKNQEMVAKTAGNGIFLAGIIYIIFLVFGFTGVNSYLKTQTADPVILDMGYRYLKICCTLSFGIILFSIYEKLLQSTGKTMFSTIAQISGALVNIILDPILIFGYFGAPKMGIDGAAYATVIGQMVSMAVAMFFHYCMNKEVACGLKYLKPEGKVIKDIYSIGLPAIIMQALMSVMTYFVNIIFVTVSASAVTAYGIFYKIQQFLFFAAFGVRDAITPLVSFNYGMGSKDRVKDGMKYGILYTEIIMLAGIIVLEIFASQFVSAFGLSDYTAYLCVLAIRIISAGFLFAGVNIALQGVFQGTEKGLSSLIVSVLRLGLISLPLAWIFTKTSQAEFLIWVSFPVAEFVAFVVSLVCAKRIKFYNKQGDGENRSVDGILF